MLGDTADSLIYLNSEYGHFNQKTTAFAVCMHNYVFEQSSN